VSETSLLLPGLLELLLLSSLSGFDDFLSGDPSTDEENINDHVNDLRDKDDAGSLL